MRARPDEVIERAAVVIVDDAIAWSGSERDLPAVQKSAGMPVDLPELDAEGRVVIPGFVDPHTHLIWAGTRREEFVARLAGQQYDGGGINTTVAATRAASDDDLLRLALERGRRMIDNGTTTVEIKTGYGLTPHDELRCLDVITRLGEQLPWHVEPTYLGAHVVPDGLTSSVTSGCSPSKRLAASSKPAVSRACRHVFTPRRSVIPVLLCSRPRPAAPAPTTSST
jgi:imidazolonepropionase